MLGVQGLLYYHAFENLGLALAHRELQVYDRKRRDVPLLAGTCQVGAGQLYDWPRMFLKFDIGPVLGLWTQTVEPKGAW